MTFTESVVTPTLSGSLRAGYNALVIVVASGLSRVVLSLTHPVTRAGDFV